MGATKLLKDFEVTPTSHLLPDYRARGGYETLEKTLRERKPEDVTKEITDSGLQGRGGAAFPVGRKWAVIKNDGQPHYLCANADEGEPGTFKDRWILEHAPHKLLESMLIASYALGVKNAFVYMRGEFDLPYRRLQGAIEEAYAAGYFGKPLFGTDFACDIFVVRGAGAYVAGEASGLLSSLEGWKAYPRNRPPRLTVKGLYQKPTVVNNVETLSNIAWIMRNGADAHKKLGVPKSPGTRLISVSGHINKPGVYEIELGYPFADFLANECGGMLHGAPLKAVIPGGVSSKMLRRDEIMPLKLESADFAKANTNLGSGGMIIMAEGTCMVHLLQILLRFYHHESCGQYTPCRDGVGWMHRIIDRIVEGKGRPEDIDILYRISNANDGTTICGMGDAAGYATVGILNKFRDEFEYYIEHGRSCCDWNLECQRSS